MDKKKFVQEGYNRIARRYHDDRDRFKDKGQLDEFTSLLPENARILDVGCGTGVPITRFLVDSGHKVVGIDFSEGMLALAREHVPEAEFYQKDITELDFDENSFDALTAGYCIFHVPREEHAGIFRKFHDILKTGGLMLVSMGSTEWEGTEDDFHGGDMFWSHYGPTRSLEIIKEAGFSIIFDRFVEACGEKHYWILAGNRK